MWLRDGQAKYLSFSSSALTKAIKLSKSTWAIDLFPICSISSYMGCKLSYSILFWKAEWTLVQYPVVRYLWIAQKTGDLLKKQDSWQFNRFSGLSSWNHGSSGRAWLDLRQVNLHYKFASYWSAGIRSTSYPLNLSIAAWQKLVRSVCH